MRLDGRIDLVSGLLRLSIMMALLAS